MLYFDNSATTVLHPEVIRVMTDVLIKYYGNPSSLHRLGVEAEKLLRRSREIVAEALKVVPQEIYFTSGGTEGDNLAIKGVAIEYRNRGKHIITTKIEHPAVKESCRQLEELGFSITYLEVDKYGFVNPQDIKKNIRTDTILVSIMHVNNEVGSIQPLEEIGQILKEFPKIFFHVDGVQGYGKVPLDLKKWHIDLYTISSHKIHGPKGIGALYVRKGINLFPLLAGGGQEAGIRSGTENIPGIVGFAKACQISGDNFTNNFNKVEEVKRYLVKLLKNRFFSVVINGPLEKGASPYILNISIPGLKGEVLLHALEKEEIFVSTGSACSSKKDILSPVLRAMGINEEVMRGSIRLSFSHNLTKNDAEQFVNSLEKISKNLI